ncbi:YqjF family protein [Pelagicoccus mobilis]|uniref:DUF2071 domain-containing protein n=1 Tax=Pelagicoccus mobilis TaxID=415221 RepID=A0A934RZN6_9BACT|nr:DUF2071 domain-containing protein [Pelagicoccus mobilis]MBK1878279.1 DUF2071 domain-containing protein [Pelagicoccus mobilis]
MNPHPAFSQTEHRPWQIPNGPWVMQQEWLDLLFIHWEIAPADLRPYIPEGLEIDTYDGKAWLGVVPFSMREVAPRGCPKPSALCDFPEINIRTYVIKDGKPGVWFFSLDVPHRLPVWIARSFFHLPYFRAEMQVEQHGDRTYYRSTYGERTFSATYRGLAPVTPERGSFEDWATERYCLYSQNKSGQLFRGEVQHPRWSVQTAEYEIQENTMLDAFPIGQMHPSVLFSKHIPVTVWWPERC